MTFEKDFEHKERLFASSIDEFCRHGYEQASINTILSNAGMSKGQFYYHFRNKEGLYFALIDILIARKVEYLNSVMKPSDYTQDIFTVFYLQIRHAMGFARAHPEINRFSQAFVREKGNPIYKRAIKKYNFEDNQAIMSMVESAHARGEFRSDLPLSFIKKTIAHLFTHAAEMLEIDETGTYEESMQYLITFMRSGLGRDDQDRPETISHRAGQKFGE